VVLDPFEPGLYKGDELVDASGGAVAQTAFEMGPDALGGVELGGAQPAGRTLRRRWLLGPRLGLKLRSQVSADCENVDVIHHGNLLAANGSPVVKLQFVLRDSVNRVNYLPFVPKEGVERLD
jgi:hypothetical protein